MKKFFLIDANKEKPTQGESKSMTMSRNPSASIATARILENKNDFSYPLLSLPLSKALPTNITTRDFDDVTFLGNGSNSFIYTAVRNGETVAVKMLKENLKHRQIAEQELILEAGILARLNHPNIISIYGAGKEIRKFIILEFLEGGTLAQTLQPSKNSSKKNFPTVKVSSDSPFVLPMRDILQISQELVRALQYLHHDFHPDATIIHRDLKPQNMGFTKDGQLKLFDFGLMSCVKRRVTSGDAYKMTGFTGTLIYMAPEVALRQPYSEKVDIYSFGMILWQMTSGQVPFVGMYREEYIEKVVKGGERPKIREDLPLLLIRLIERCWDRDPALRPNCEEILEILDSCMESLGRHMAIVSVKRMGNKFMKIFGKGSVAYSQVGDEASLT